MTAALVAVALGMVPAPQQPEITASVDRAKVARGDTVTLTIHVAATGNEPVRIADPELSGLELVDSREVSRVQMVAGVAQRVTQRVLRLRAVSVGPATIGGLRVAQGGRSARAGAHRPRLRHRRRRGSRARRRLRSSTRSPTRSARCVRAWRAAVRRSR